MSPPPAPSPLDELHALVLDLQSHVDWEASRGAWAFPAQRAVARAAEAAPRPAPPAAAPRPAPPPLSPSLPGQGAHQGWARLASPEALVAGASAPAGASELHGPLARALAHPDPAERLEGIRAVIGDCRRCRLCERRRQVVFGVGDPRARLLVLGEGPGEQEDRQGEPFVGPAGQMLDKMIENVLGLSRPSVYIVNMVKCRPPDNRNPQPDELSTCRPFLDAQLAAVQPSLVLLLGSVASLALLGRGITQTRGRWHRLAWPGGEAQAMATFHPAYLLRKPEEKKATFGDLKLLRQALDALPGRPPGS